MKPQSRWVPFIFILALFFYGCGGNGSTAGSHTTAEKPTANPTATSTVDPAATPTFGPACSGSLWTSSISSAGTDIPLPQSTVAGLVETFPTINGWTGRYRRLCSSGNNDSVSSFINTQMKRHGWSYGPPSGGCTCNGLSVWSRSNDGRLVQFDDHPTMNGGHVQYGVTIFTQG
jgi:hypothetical protein